MPRMVKNTNFLEGINTCIVNISMKVVSLPLSMTHLEQKMGSPKMNSLQIFSFSFGNLAQLSSLLPAFCGFIQLFNACTDNQIVELWDLPRRGDSPTPLLLCSGQVSGCQAYKLNT